MSTVGPVCVPPAVTLKMGRARVTESLVSVLSVVTARGVAMTSVWLSLLNQDRTPLTPSASKKAVLGLKPRLVSARSPGWLRRLLGPYVVFITYPRKFVSTEIDLL